MKTNSGPTKEEINAIEKGKGKDFRKQSSGKDRKGKKGEETPKKKKHSGNKKCKLCGKQQRHTKKKDCLAYNKKCNFCQKWYHFPSVCMSRKKSEVNLLEENYESSEESILKVEEISTVESSGNRWFETLSFHSKQARHQIPIKCQLDTGATCNVLSFRDSIITQDGNPPVEQTKTKLKLLDNSMMKPLGVVNLRVTYGSQTQVLKSQVVSGSNKPLLSAQTCQKLGLSS